MAHNPEVAGSNPAPATRQNGLGNIVSGAVFCYLRPNFWSHPLPDRWALRPGVTAGVTGPLPVRAAPVRRAIPRQLQPETRPRRPFNEQEATLSNQRRRRPAPRSFAVRHVRSSNRMPSGGCAPCSADADDYETGRPPADQNPHGTLGREQLGGVSDKTRATERPEVLALSPERGAMPRIVAAVPERIQEHHTGRGERVSGRATLAQAGTIPPG